MNHSPSSPEPKTPFLFRAVLFVGWIVYLARFGLDRFLSQLRVGPHQVRCCPLPVSRTHVRHWKEGSHDQWY